MRQTQELQNEKARKYQAFLKENKIAVFSVEQRKDEAQSVIFRSRMEVKGQELPAMIVMDAGIYVLIRVQIARSAVNEENRAALESLLTGYNRTYKPFKYYAAEDGMLCLDCCLVAADEQFDSALLQTMLQVILQHLYETYPVIMRCVWNEAAKGA